MAKATAARRTRPKKGKSSKAMTVRRNNPNNVNQYTDPDPRQSLFLAGYLDPKRPTFSNALQSALAAGYSQEYSESLTAQMPLWLSEGLGKQSRVALAEKHLDEVLSLPIVMQAMGAFGPIFTKEERIVTKKLKNGKTRNEKEVIKVPVMVPNTGIIKEKTKVMQFALESLDKATYGKTGVKIGFNFNMRPQSDRYET